jgi:cation diffusion facilitator family transporter
MHRQSIAPWRHNHVFLGAEHAHNERRTWFVVALTSVMMVAEIAAGIAFGSMALLADGFHMATHAGALAISALAYLYARRHAQDSRFSFGTGKLGDLAAFTSAIILGFIAALIAYESFVRLAAPIAIKFNQAIGVAVLGLVVNLTSAWLLRGGNSVHHNDAHHHGHNGYGHGRRNNHHHREEHFGDHNLRSAYLHVLADALTSVLAIVGLIAGRAYGWLWMDPLMGIVGALVIARWSAGLMRDAGAILVDVVPDRTLAEDIRRALERDGDRVSDLHLWRVGPGHLALIVSLVADRPRAPDDYKARLSTFPRLSHVTVEVQPCSTDRRAA